ncbi:MAG: hypothetical protein KKI09_11510 [Spirochaetes bacterium]|nr:hypothetical protein [Spirochaetota bacterium]
MRHYTLLLLGMLLVLSAWPNENRQTLGGDASLSQIPDSADLRTKYWDTFLETGSRAATDQTIYDSNAWGHWQISRLNQAGSVYTIISPAKGDQWPVHAQGSWIIKRAGNTGSWEQAKIFLRSDPELYIRLYPHGNRTHLDVLAYGAVLYHQVIIPLSFRQVLTRPLADIIKMTADIVDWSVFSPNITLYRDLRDFADKIRQELPGLRYAEDGALDEDGKAVFIDSLLEQPAAAGLNCSGFLKWIVDGMLYPINGSYLSIETLKTRMITYRGSSFTESWEELFDPFFGLDWCRALASAAWSTVYNRQPAAPTAHDVAEPGFALMLTANGALPGKVNYSNFPAPQDNTGVHLSGLKAYLFLLASREPGTMYFAQFNARDTKDLVLRRYFHVAAFLPYFDDQGIFRVAVFESAAETSLAAVLGNPRYEFVNLIRMPILHRFQPPRLP